MMEPLKFQPKLKSRVWGGRKLRRYGKRLPPRLPIGESWEICDNLPDVSRVSEGMHKGMFLHDLIHAYPQSLIGQRQTPLPYGRFPLLVKFIDATKMLSLQVHPDDEYAAKHDRGQTGKTEAWYVVEAEPGAHLYCGLEDGVTRDDFVEALQKGNPQDLVIRHAVKAGDAFFIPPGTVHAIGPGILLVEVQECSHLTYRVFDWGRAGRELHIQKALDVIQFSKRTGGRVGAGGARGHGGQVERVGPIRQLVSCDKFRFELLRCDRDLTLANRERRPHILVVIEGRGSLLTDTETGLDLGDTILVPADTEQYAVRPDGSLRLLRAI